MTPPFAHTARGKTQLRAQQHVTDTGTQSTHTLLHQPHIHPNSSSAEVPHIPLCSLPSQPLHCSSSIRLTS